VTSGVGTTNQTLQDVGTFNAPSSGGWGNNNMVQLKATDGTTAYFKLSGGAKTLRFTTATGDFDWFVLVPVTGIPPKVISTSPAGDNPRAPYGGSVKQNAPIDVTITDLATSVVTNTVKLVVDGVDVTSSATIAKNGDLTTVHYAPGSLFSVGAHTYSVLFADNGTPPLSQTNTVAFTVNVVSTPGSFLIEAEDFDFNSGQHQAATDTMPYTGGTYSNLNAIVNVDYFNNDGLNSFPYRPGLTNNVYVDATGKTNSANANMDRTGDTDRGTWTNVVNFKCGWTDSADWFNYTRTFPAGKYAVYAALSHGDAVGTANDLRGTLQLVTAGVGTTNQTLTQLGNFNGPSTGAWGRNALVPLMDTNSATAVVVSLSGLNTIRFTADSGDYDYLWFVPATPSLRFTSINASGGSVTINWTGTGTLQQAASLTGQASDWSNVTPPPSGNTYTVTAGTSGNKFFRLKQ
jgi:hypothetical protein